MDEGFDDILITKYPLGEWVSCNIYKLPLCSILFQTVWSARFNIPISLPNCFTEPLRGSLRGSELTQQIEIRRDEIEGRRMGDENTSSEHYPVS